MDGRLINRRKPSSIFFWRVIARVASRVVASLLNAAILTTPFRGRKAEIQMRQILDYFAAGIIG